MSAETNLAATPDTSTNEVRATNKSRWVASLLAIACGAPLLIVATIGGAGLGAFSGLEGALVGGAMAVLLVGMARGTLGGRRHSGR